MYIYIYIYRHTHTYIHTYLHTYLHTYIPTHLHTYIPTYLHIHTCMHTYMHACMHAYIHTQLDVYLSLNRKGFPVNMCTISQSLSYIWSFTVLSPQGMWIMQVCLVFAGGLIWKQVSITHDCLAMLWPNFTIDMNKMFGVKSNSERRLAIIYTDSWFCLWGLKNQWSVYTELPQAFEPSRVQKLYTMWGQWWIQKSKTIGPYLLSLAMCEESPCKAHQIHSPHEGLLWGLELESGLSMGLLRYDMKPFEFSSSEVRRYVTLQGNDFWSTTHWVSPSKMWVMNYQICPWWVK